MIGRASSPSNGAEEDASCAGKPFWGSPATWIVLACAAAGLFVGLGAPVYETGDVARYAQMVLEMRHAQTLVPTLEGHPYHEAAPLAAWAPYAATWMIGHLSPFAVRLPSALAALATCVLVLELGRRRSPRAGQIAGAAFVLNELTLVYGHGSRVDALLGFAVSAAVVAFFAGTRAASAPRRLLLYALAGASAALGIAAKGPAAAVLVGAALGPVLAYERRWRALVVGGALALAVAVGLTAVWLLPYLHYLGPAEAQAFYRQFLLEETVAKVADGYGKAAPFWTYLVEATPKLAPWSLLGAAALWRILRSPGRASGVERLCASWLVFPVILLSAATGKHMRYLIPLVPALALLAGAELDRWLDAVAPRRLRALQVGLGVVGVVVAAAGAAAPIVLALLYGPSAYAIATGVVAALAGVATLRLAWRGQRAPALLSLHVGAIAIVAFVYAAVLPLPVVARQESYVRLAEAMAPHLRPADAPLWVVQPGDPARAVAASQLALHLGNRWVAPTAAEHLPDAGLILASAPLPGRAVRARLAWRRHRRGLPETWYLLEAGVASRPQGKNNDTPNLSWASAPPSGRTARP